MRTGNTNSVQVGMLALFLWLKSKKWWRCGSILGGTVIGLLIMFKPNLVFVPVMLMASMVINRRHAEFLYWTGGFIAATATAFVSSSIFLGTFYCWSEWLTALRDMPGDIIGVSSGNFSLVRLLLVTLGINTTLFLTLVFITLTVVFVWLGRRTSGWSSGGTLSVMHDHERNLAEDWLMVGAGCLIYLLSAPLVWIHYLLLTVPATIFLLRPVYPLRLFQHGFAPYRCAIAALTIAGLMITPYVKLFNIGDVRTVIIVTSLSTFSLLVLTFMELFMARGPQGYGKIRGVEEVEAG